MMVEQGAPLFAGLAALCIVVWLYIDRLKNRIVRSAIVEELKTAFPRALQDVELRIAVQRRIGMMVSWTRFSTETFKLGIEGIIRELNGDSEKNRREYGERYFRFAG